MSNPEHEEGEGKPVAWQLYMWRSSFECRKSSLLSSHHCRGHTHTHDGTARTPAGRQNLAYLFLHHNTDMTHSLWLVLHVDVTDSNML